MGVLVTAVSLAVGLVSRSVAWGIVCFLFLLAVVIFVQPRIASRWNAFRRRAKAKRAAAAKEAERERYIPTVAAWEAFTPAASEVLRQFYELRENDRTEDQWRGFREATQRAQALAAELYEPAKSGALDLLRPFGEVAKEEMGRCSVQASDLGNWLTRQNRDYLRFR